MKKHILLLCLGIAFKSALFSQSNKFGTISGNVGVNLGINAIAIQQANITSFAISEDIAAAITHFPIELNFGLLKPISVGLNYAPSNWHLIGEGIILSGKFNSIGLNANLYIINKNRFNLQLSLTPSILSFKPVSLSFDQNNSMNMDFEGTAFKTRLMFNIYFSDNAGMYFDFGYSSYNIGVKEYDLKFQDVELDAELKNLINQDFKLKLPGIQAGVGVVFKLFNGFESKK